MGLEREVVKRSFGLSSETMLVLSSMGSLPILSSIGLPPVSPIMGLPLVLVFFPLSSPLNQSG